MMEGINNMMGNLGNIGDAVKLGTKLVNVLERVVTDTEIREEFRAKGFIQGTFSLNDYGVNFMVYNKKKTSIPAQVEKVENAETSESAGE